MTGQFYGTVTFSLHDRIIEAVLWLRLRKLCARRRTETGKGVVSCRFCRWLNKSDSCLEFLLFILRWTSVWMSALARQLFLVSLCVCYSGSELSWLSGCAYFDASASASYSCAPALSVPHTTSMSYRAGSVSRRRFTGWGKFLGFSGGFFPFPETRCHVWTEWSFEEKGQCRRVFPKHLHLRYWGSSTRTKSNTLRAVVFSLSSVHEALLWPF